MNGARGVVEGLLDEKAEVIFGIPGGAALPIYDEFHKEPNLRHIHMMHEQGAAHAAEGYSRVLGKVGLCMGTSGPGATNLVTGIADAFMDSVPIVALTGQVPTKLLGKDAFQETDTFGITLPITKHNFRLSKSEDAYQNTRDAFNISLSGRPGPVLIDLPKDTMVGEFELNKEQFKYTQLKALPQNSNEVFSKVVDLLFNAERPMILAGGGVTIANAGLELTKLAELLRCYVATTITARGAIPTTHPLSLGQIGMHGRQVVNHSIANCDLLLAVGTRFSDRITGNLEAFAPNAKIIHIDIDATELGKNVPFHMGIVSDAKTALQSILAVAAQKKLQGKDNLFRQRVKALDVECRCNIASDDTPIRPETIIKEINEILPENAIVTTEVGHHQMFATHFLKVKNPRHFLTSAGAGTMGFGLPAAIGAKVAAPDQPVIDISGDGSLIMVCQEIATAVENDIPLTIALFNNGGYGIVQQWQKEFYEGRKIAVEFGKHTDFVKLAQSMGAEGIKVERPSEIQEAMKQAIMSDKVFLVDIATSTVDNGMPLVPPLGKNTEMLLGQHCPLVNPRYFDAE